MHALLLDIGNSRIKWRLDDLSGPPASSAAVDARALDEAWRAGREAIATEDVHRLAAQWSDIAGEDVASAVISNVASAAVGSAVEHALRATWPAIRVDPVTAPAIEGGVVNGYAVPAQLGPDRWMAAVGAHAMWPRASLLVCSFGTATTIDLLTVDAAADATPARFVGGLILPGPETMRRALAEGTARLPAARGAVTDFADNTDDAIASGIAAAQMGAVVRALAAARRRAAEVAVVVAGGASRPLLQAFEALDARHHAVPDLVLRGLAVRARTDL